MGKTKSLFSGFLFVFLIGEVLFYFFGKTVFNHINLTRFLSCVIIIVCVTIVLFAVNNHSTNNQLGALRTVVLFLISYIIVHFQFYLDHVFGISKYRLSFYSLSTVIKSALLSLIGLHVFLLAYTNTNIEINRKKPRNTLSSIHISTRVMKGLTILSFFWLLYCGRGFYFHMSYGSVNLIGTKLAYAMQLFSLLSNSTLLLCSYDYQQRNENSILGFIRNNGFLFNLTLLLFIVATFSSGDRGPAMFMVIGYLVAVSVATNKKIRYLQLVLLLIIGALFISLWGIVRESGSLSDVSGQMTSAYYDLSNEQSIVPATKELACSIRTLHMGVEMVPETFPHANGVFQLSYIIESLPFYSRLFPSLHSSIGYNHSTTFLTWLINGDLETSGVGTTCIADAYIDLGLVGVIIILLLWGIVVKRSELLFSVPLSSLSLFQIAFSFIVITVSIYIPRSAILFSLKDVIWLFLFLLLLSVFSKITN